MVADNVVFFRIFYLGFKRRQDLPVKIVLVLFERSFGFISGLARIVMRDFGIIKNIAAENEAVNLYLRNETQ